MAEKQPRTVWAIEVDGEAAGGIGIEQLTDVERVSAEIGYWLGEAHWGKGVMTEALIAVTADVFQRFDLLRIFALPFADNIGSIRVLEKAGYVLEGRLRHSTHQGRAGSRSVDVRDATSRDSCRFAGSPRRDFADGAAAGSRSLRSRCRFAARSLRGCQRRAPIRAPNGARPAQRAERRAHPQRERSEREPAVRRSAQRGGGRSCSRASAAAKDEPAAHCATLPRCADSSLCPCSRSAVLPSQRRRRHRPQVSAHRRQHHARPGAGRAIRRRTCAGRATRRSCTSSGACRAKTRRRPGWSAREGGQPRRLSDEERRSAPLANGAWDSARRRILGADRGDIVVIDTVARKRLDVTRTTGAESSPRWARGGTHVTFVRDNNLFIVPVEGAVDRHARAADRCVGAPRPTRGRPTVSAWCGKKRRSCSTGSSRRPSGASGARSATARGRCREFELAERQTIVDAALSADETYAYLVVSDRAQARDRAGAALRERVGVHRGDPGAHQGRRRAGSPAAGDSESEDRRAVCGPGSTASSIRSRFRSRLEGDERLAAPAAGRRPRPRRRHRSATCAGARCCCRPTARSPWPRSARPTTTTAGWCLVDPATGKTQRARRACKTKRGCGRSARRATSAAGWAGCRTTAASGFSREHDGWMHLYTVDVTARASRAQAADDRPLRDRHASTLSPDGVDVLHPVDRAASRRAAPVRDERRRRRAHEADDAHRRVRRRDLARQLDVRRDLLGVDASRRRST